jgi:hypothetical protein
MEQISLWDAHSHPSGQEMPPLLEKPKFHYNVQNSSPVDPIMSQFNSVQILIFYLFKIGYILILQRRSELQISSHFLLFSLC